MIKQFKSVSQTTRKASSCYALTTHNNKTIPNRLLLTPNSPPLFYHHSPAHFSASDNDNNHENDSSNSVPMSPFHEDPKHKGISEVFRTYHSRFNTILSKSKTKISRTTTTTTTTSTTTFSNKSSSSSSVKPRRERASSTSRNRKSSGFSSGNRNSGEISSSTMTTSSVVVAASPNVNKMEQKVKSRHVSALVNEKFSNEKLSRLFGIQSDAATATKNMNHQENKQLVSDDDEASSTLIDDSMSSFFENDAAKKQVPMKKSANAVKQVEAEQELNQLVEKLFSVSTESAQQSELEFHNSFGGADFFAGSPVRASNDDSALRTTSNNNNGGSGRNLKHLLQSNEKQFELDDSIFNQRELMSSGESKTSQSVSASGDFRVNDGEEDGDGDGLGYLNSGDRSSSRRRFSIMNEEEQQADASEETRRNELIDSLKRYINHLSPEYMRPPTKHNPSDTPMLTSLLNTVKKSVELNEQQYAALEKAFIRKHFMKKIVVTDNVPQKTIELANPEQEIDPEIALGVLDDFSQYEAPNIDFNAMVNQVRQENPADFLNSGDNDFARSATGRDPPKIAYDSLGYQYVPTTFEEETPVFAVDTDRIIRRKPATAKSEIDMLLGDLETEEELEMVRTQRSLFGETHEGAATMSLQGETSFNPTKYEKLDIEDFKNMVFFGSGSESRYTQMLEEVVDEEEIQHRKQDEEYSSILDEGFLSLQQLKSNHQRQSASTVSASQMVPCEDEEQFFQNLMKSYEEK